MESYESPISFNLQKSHSMLTRSQTSAIKSNPNTSETTKDLQAIIYDDSMSSEHHKGISFLTGRPKVTRPKPFSFHFREIALIHRRNDRAVATELPSNSNENSSSEHSYNRSQKSRGIPNRVFQPLPSNCPPTIPITPALHTSKRAVSRVQFEKEAFERREWLQNKAIENEKKLQEMEANQIKLMRRESVRKACPIRRYKPVECPKPRPPTEPKSPNFSVLHHCKK